MPLSGKPGGVSYRALWIVELIVVPGLVLKQHITFLEQLRLVIKDQLAAEWAPPSKKLYTVCLINTLFR